MLYTPHFRLIYMGAIFVIIDSMQINKHQYSMKYERYSIRYMYI